MIKIDNELLAAYAEGKVSQEEREAVRQYLVDHPEEMESVMMLTDDSFMDNCNIGSMDHDDGEYLDNLSTLLDEIYQEESVLPMMAMAAQNTVDNLCVIRCEGIALRHFGIDITDKELENQSEQAGYLLFEGTALHNIGRLAGARGLNVSHRYNCNLKDITQVLMKGDVVIAVVNEYHAIIIESLSEKAITVRDSATPETFDTWSLSKFLESWQPSSKYLTIISNNEEYIPHPINLDDVVVEDELIELREAIAENAHEVWAESRRNEGWTYGLVRDDVKKQTPDMLPYNRLPESEKEYDRIMAMNTIKLVKKLGWEFKKKK